MDTNTAHHTLAAADFVQHPLSTPLSPSSSPSSSSFPSSAHRRDDCAEPKSDRFDHHHRHAINRFFSAAAAAAAAAAVTAAHLPMHLPDLTIPSSSSSSHVPVPVAPAASTSPVPTSTSISVITTSPDSSSSSSGPPFVDDARPASPPLPLPVPVPVPVPAVDVDEGDHNRVHDHDDIYYSDTMSNPASEIVDPPPTAPHPHPLNPSTSTSTPTTTSTVDPDDADLDHQISLLENRITLLSAHSHHAKQTMLNDSRATFLSTAADLIAILLHTVDTTAAAFTDINVSSRFHVAVNLALAELQSDAVVLAHWFAAASARRVANAMRMDETFGDVGERVNLLMPLYYQLKRKCGRRLDEFYEEIATIGQQFVPK